MIQKPEQMSGMTDEQLVQLAQAGNTESLTVLVERYKRLIDREVGDFSKIGLDREDIFQEALIGLYRAIQSYDSRKEARFKTYAMVCVHNGWISAVRFGSSSRHTPLNNSISLDDDLWQDALQLIDESAVNPENWMIRQERMKQWQQQIQTLLSDFERDVLRLYLTGFSYDDMAKKLSSTAKAVDNALQRVRRKLRSANTPGNES